MHLKLRSCSSFLALASIFALMQAPLSSQAAGEKKLEVFSWWTSGGEAAALDALFSTYKKQDPGVQIINATVAGGGGSAARPVLQTRLAGGNPPEPWQDHLGLELCGQKLPAGTAGKISHVNKAVRGCTLFPTALLT